MTTEAVRRRLLFDIDHVAAAVSGTTSERRAGLLRRVM
jgi:hypothetical protein